MSSEYTPTTQDIEDRYAYDEWDVDAEESQKPRKERFRRWLAAELAAAEKRGAVKALHSLSDRAEAIGQAALDEMDIPLWIDAIADEMEADA